MYGRRKDNKQFACVLPIFHQKKDITHFVQYKLMLCSVRVTYVVGLDYRIRKQHRKTLEEHREKRAKKWEEERVKQVEEEIQRQKEEDR